MKLFITVLSAICLVLMTSCSAGQKNDEHTHESKEHDHSTDGEIKPEEHSHTHDNHTVAVVKRSDFNMVYKTSGIITSDNRGISQVVAKAAGIVRFEKAKLYPGTEVKEGETLFRLAGENLVNYNTEAEFKKIESAYETALANFDRASKLIKEKLITEQHFLQIKSVFESAKADYDSYNIGSVKLNSVVSSITGYINSVNVSEGQMVNEGDILASVINTDKLVLKADVPVTDMHILKEIKSANFRSGDSNITFKLDDLGGEFISGGLSVEQTVTYIPVYFSFNNTVNLVPGTFTDIWLKGRTIQEAVSIPNTSIMEEYGRYYVFVENQDHKFEKRFIERAHTDGIRTMVLSGLHEGEVIVTTGTYQVKLALLEGTVPDIHAGHSH